MKANELMIGDWVSCNGFQRQIDFIDLQSIFFDQDIAEPISLTEEILKANGFWEEGGGFAKFFPSVGKFTTWKSRIEDIQCTLLGTVELPLRYVHQLQHALRLCGLYEFADNLKVE